MNENLNRLEMKYVLKAKKEHIETGTIKTVNEFDGSYK